MPSEHSHKKRLVGKNVVIGDDAGDILVQIEKHGVWITEDNPHLY